LIGSKRAGFVAFGIGLASILMGCGGGSDGFPGSGQNTGSLTGTWIKRGLSYQGNQVSCPNSIDGSTDQTVSSLTVNNVVLDACGYNEEITFNSDGTYMIVIPAPRLGRLTEVWGTYKVSGSTITLTSTSTGYDTNNDGQIESNEITTLVSVSDPNNIPANAEQRSVYQISVGANSLQLTSVVEPITNSSGATIVNSDGTVNAHASGDTQTYGRS
jgi:hypothetical protein